VYYLDELEVEAFFDILYCFVLARTLMWLRLVLLFGVMNDTPLQAMHIMYSQNCFIVTKAGDEFLSVLL